MDVFQWDKYHIDLFVQRFRNRQDDIDSRTVQHAFRNIQRQQRIPKLNTRDYKNLMRLIVQNKYARVVKGCITSNNYRIKMISDKYHYTKILFDEELFRNPIFVNPILELRDKDWDSDTESYWIQCCSIANLLSEAFLAYNFCGGDYDIFFENEGILVDKKVKYYRDYFCSIVNAFVCTYKAWKLADCELLKFLENDNKFYASYRGTGVSIHVNVKDRNSLFAVIFRSNITLRFLGMIEGESQSYRGVGQTQYRKMKERIKDFDEEILIAADQVPDVTNEIVVLHALDNLWLWLSSISSKAEVVEAMEDCKQAHLNVSHNFANTLLIPIEKKSKPPTNFT